MRRDALLPLSMTVETKVPVIIITVLVTTFYRLVIVARFYFGIFIVITLILTLMGRVNIFYVYAGANLCSPI